VSAEVELRMLEESEMYSLCLLIFKALHRLGMMENWSEKSTFLGFVKYNTFYVNTFLVF